MNSTTPAPVSSLKFRPWPALARAEFKAFMSTPAAGLALAVFAFLNGYLFYNRLLKYSLAIRPANQPELAGQALEILLPSIFPQAALALMFTLPLVTMRSFAPSLKGGDYDLLASWPLTLGQILWGHYLAALYFLLILLGLAALPVVVLKLAGLGSAPLSLAGFLGLALTGAAFAALGLLASAASSGQTGAAALGWMMFLALWLLGWSAPYTGPRLRAVLQQLAFEPRLIRFSSGLIYVGDVVFLLSLTALALASAYWLLRIRVFREG